MPRRPGSPRYGGDGGQGENVVITGAVVVKMVIAMFVAMMMVIMVVMSPRAWYT